MLFHLLNGSVIGKSLNYFETLGKLFSLNMMPGHFILSNHAGRVKDFWTEKYNTEILQEKRGNTLG